MAPRNKSHRTLSAASRNHSTTSLHKGEARLTGLTTIHKDKPAGNPRDALHKSKKHSSSSSALAAKRTASKTSVHRSSSTRLPQQQMKQEAEDGTKQGDDEAWVSSDEEDDELDDDEILVLQTQRAQRNAREAEKLKAAVKAAEVEILAKQRQDSEPVEESGEKHTTMPPALSQSPSSAPQATHSSPGKQPPAQARQQVAPTPTRQPQAPLVRQPLPSHHPEPSRHHPEPSRQVPATLAPVIQHVPDHTKHTFPSKASPSPPAPLPSSRNGPRYSDPTVPQPHTNGAHDKPSPNDRSSDRHQKLDDDHRPSRPQPRRSQSHISKPTIQAPGRSLTMAPPARLHPLIRAPSILTKAVPALSPLTAPPYLSAHSAQAQISSSPPPGTPSTSSPPHTRQPSLSSSTHTLPTLQVSPTAALTTSVSSLPHSPHSSPTASFKPIPERERTVSAVSSTAALHALHNPHRRPYRSLGAVALSTFPAEPADTYNGGMYPGSGLSLGGVAGGSTAVVGASGGMYGGKPGPVHALLPAPYMATHLSIGRWFSPARDAVGRVVRGRPSQ